MAPHLSPSPPIQVRSLHTTIAFIIDSRGRDEVDHTSHCMYCVGALQVCPSIGQIGMVLLQTLRSDLHEERLPPARIRLLISSIALVRSDLMYNQLNCIGL